MANGPLETVAGAYKDHNDLKRLKEEARSARDLALLEIEAKSAEAFHKLQMANAAKTVEQGNWRPLWMKTLRHAWIAMFSLPFIDLAVRMISSVTGSSLPTINLALIYGQVVEPLTWLTALSFGVYAPARTIEKAGGIVGVGDVVKGMLPGGRKAKSQRRHTPEYRPGPQRQSATPVKRPAPQTTQPAMSAQYDEMDFHADLGTQAFTPEDHIEGFDETIRPDANTEEIERHEPPYRPTH